MKSLTGSSNSRSLSDIASTEVITTHTAKWMQAPLELTNINIKYKLKLVHDLQGNPSDLEEWQLMGNKERIDRIYMATIASRHKVFCSDNNIIFATGNRECASYDAIQTKTIIRSLKTAKFCRVVKVLSSHGKHRKSLDSYLGKLHDNVSLIPLRRLNQRTETIGNSDEVKVDNDLKSLEKYHGKAKEDAASEIYANEDLLIPIKAFDKKYQESGSGVQKSLSDYVEFITDDTEMIQNSRDEAYDFYIIGIFASINIAVFLFEIATPVKNSNLHLFSLPMVYGAKINNLILTGEWWRLVTPMFLHAGVLHMALGSWVLFTFGLEVSREYGLFTFLFVYVLGGLSGNIISFLHTPGPTVGGTGPAFAIIGAWLIYQLQNKDVIPRETSEKMFQKAIIATALSFFFSTFGPIDDWAHFVSTFTGIAYGFVTCPILQVKDASSESGQQERITLVRRYADPCKSLSYFFIFLLLLSSLVFIIEPPLDL